MQKSSSELAIAAGLDSLVEVSRLTGVGLQTLHNWKANKPKLFKIVLNGCKVSKDRTNGIKKANNK